jgi:hypothetical protein
MEIEVKPHPGVMSCFLLCATLAGARAQDLSAAKPPPDYKGQKFEILGDAGPSSSGVSVTTPAGFHSITTVPMYPVLFCGDAGGGGPNEFPVRAGAGPVRWLLEVPSPPVGAKMFDVRYEPYDNIAAINSFAEMLVEKVDETHISITTQAYPNCAGARVRLRITVSYAS